MKYHPAYHQLMSNAIGRGLHASPWTTPGPGAHVARAARSYLQTQVEAGHGCPITMTFAAVPTLRLQPGLARRWLPALSSLVYDPRNLPAAQKLGLTLGMAMTEKQGGSDVRSNSTQAHPLSSGGPGQACELVGHKYFVSAPMCDAFLVLAQASDGLSCFLLPRWRPDGSKNPMQSKRTPGHAFEAMECIGGSGVMEDSMMPRLYREAPVNAIWEGSGNVQCLDVLRALSKTLAVLDAFFAEVSQAQGGHAALDRLVAGLANELNDLQDFESRARDVVDRMALALQASLLVRHAPAFVSDAAMRR